MKKKSSILKSHLNQITTINVNLALESLNFHGKQGGIIKTVMMIKYLNLTLMMKLKCTNKNSGSFGKSQEANL